MLSNTSLHIALLLPHVRLVWFLFENFPTFVAPSDWIVVRVGTVPAVLQVAVFSVFSSEGGAGASGG